MRKSKWESSLNGGEENKWLKPPSSILLVLLLLLIVVAAIVLIVVHLMVMMRVVFFAILTKHGATSLAGESTSNFRHIMYPTHLLAMMLCQHLHSQTETNTKDTMKHYKEKVSRTHFNLHSQSLRWYLKTCAFRKDSAFLVTYFSCYVLNLEV